MSVSVCLCMFVCPRSYLRNCISKFLCMLPMALAWTFSCGVVTRYVLSFFWMTSYLLISQGCSTSPPMQLKRSAYAALGLAINCAVIPVAGQRTHGTTFRALKLTSLVSTPGAESVVCVLLLRCKRLGAGLHI